MVTLDELTSEDEDVLRSMITKHLKVTQSEIAVDILENWDKEIKKFVKVFPVDYKRILLKKLTETVAA